MNISSPIRILYRSIGNIIGKQVWDRLAHSEYISSDPEKRREIASSVIASITKFRKLLKNRHKNKGDIFDEITKHIESLFEDNSSLAIKQLAWIFEAYLLLNQSSTASAEAISIDTRLSDTQHAINLKSKLVESGLSEEDFETLASGIGAALVFTAHPTAGIQPDYIRHIGNMLDTVQKLVSQGDLSKYAAYSDEVAVKLSPGNFLPQSGSFLARRWYEMDPNFDIGFIQEIKSDLRLSISHMVRAKPYNEDKIRPQDESRNFLANIDKAWDIVPRKLIAIENILAVDLNPRAFRVHTWVARDLDGNPTVTRREHLESIKQEKFTFLKKYLVDLRKLYELLSDDFSSEKRLPKKTAFVDAEFKALYEQALPVMTGYVPEYQAYRVVLQFHCIEVLERAIRELDLGDETDAFDIEANFLVPLRAIKRNKEGLNTKEIDLLIKKAEIFGTYGSWGHTRQGAKVLNELMQRCLKFDPKAQSFEKTEFVLAEGSAFINTVDLKNNLEASLSKGSDNEAKLFQTADILELASKGAIRRQIISMNSCFGDMLNALALARSLDLFRPSTYDNLPSCALEIVPLTERIIDLRNSYKVTIEALSNAAWREYLIANEGRFIKMRGPSDSAKQNGFVASQWEMFRSKHLDAIVVDIFNAYLSAYVFDDDDKLECWKTLSDRLGPTNFETPIVEEALTKFGDLFRSETFVTDSLEKKLWRQARERGLNKVNLVSFDGWGEPIERGGGLEFRETLSCTQPDSSSLEYERTLQGGGAQQFASEPRTKHAIQDLLSALFETGARKIRLARDFAKAKHKSTKLKILQEVYVLDPDFANMMDTWTQSLRASLREEVFGMDLEDDLKVSCEDNLRDYFRHVIKSPLVHLDFFNIASRPVSRSGSKIKEILEEAKYKNNIDKLVAKFDPEEMLKILDDVRAIPYAAMFNLLGGNHVSYYGFHNLLANEEMLETIIKFYHRNDGSQETRLIRHIIDSLEKGLFTADLDCYAEAHQVIEHATNPDYHLADDVLMRKLLAAQEAALKFVAQVKKYKINDKDPMTVEDLMQDDKELRELMIARRNDAVVPRIGLAYAMAVIFRDCHEKDINPLDIDNVEIEYLDLLRKAFAAGASTFGNGCID